MRDLILEELQVPCFEHPEKAFCGPHCAMFMLEAHGKKWRGAWPTKVKAAFPKRMVQMLTNNGQGAEIVSVPRDRRIIWLQEKIQEKKTAALFVRAKSLVPLPLHWVVVCGVSGPSSDSYFYIYDDRIGESARNPRLPIGNTIWFAEKVGSLWQAAPLFRKTSTAVVTL